MTMDLQLWSHPRSRTATPTTKLPEHNEKLFTRENLIDILADFSCRTLQVFQRPIRLVVHGGAVMLLHSGLYSQPGSSRRATRDVDYIHRSFVEEWRLLGVYDAEARLQSCINATAQRFQLGIDWMNAHADVALPMAHDTQGRPYDPIYTASLKPNNIHLHTVYTSAGLTLVSVTPFWAVALKMVRYLKDDPADITAILRNGTRLNGVQWSPEVLEKWLLTECWAMGYASYPSWLIHDMREKIGHAVRQLNAPPQSDQSLSRQSSMDLALSHSMPAPHQQLASQHPSMDVGPPHLSQPSIPPPRSSTPPTHPVIPPSTSHSRHRGMQAMPVRHHHSLETLHPSQQQHHARSISRNQSLPLFGPSQQPFQHISAPRRESLTMPSQHPPMPTPVTSQQHTSIPGQPVPHQHHPSQMARPHSMSLLMPPQQVSSTLRHAASPPLHLPPAQTHPPASHHASTMSSSRHPMAMQVAPPAMPIAQPHGVNIPPTSHNRTTPGHFMTPPQHGDEFQRHGGMLNWMPQTHSIMVRN